jgi:hypothetical protein
MDDFVTRHAPSIAGVVHGFDRLILRGVLRSVKYAKALDRFLGAHHVLLKDFSVWSRTQTAKIAAHAEQVAAQAHRPFEFLASSAVEKDEYARRIAARDQVREGLICVFSVLEPCVSADLRSDRQSGHLTVIFRQRRCRFFYFYYLDREFGLMHLRLQSWVPFDLQVYINGRHYLARQMQREHIAFEQRDNCFTSISDYDRAQILLDQLTTRNWPATLNVYASRINPLLKSLGLTGEFGYYWTIAESEYATDIVFTESEALARIYPPLIDHALNHFSCRDVIRFLSGRQVGRLPNEVKTSHKERSEGVRIKHTVNSNSIKMYDKQQRVLRIETTINNPRQFQVMCRKGRGPVAWRKMCRGVKDIARRVEVSRAANERYAQALSVVGEPTPSHQLLDAVSHPVVHQGHRHRAIRPISPEDSRLFQAILHGGHLINGFTNRQLQPYLFEQPPADQADASRRSGFVSRQLSLLRSHGLIRKVGNRKLYRTTLLGHKVMTTALGFRTTDLAILQAGVA